MKGELSWGNGTNQVKKKKEDQAGFIFIVNLITEHIIKIWIKILNLLYMRTMQYSM